MTAITYIIIFLCFGVLDLAYCQNDTTTPPPPPPPTQQPPQQETPPQQSPQEPKRPPPAFVASQYNKPMHLQPAMSKNSYNLFDSLILGLGWFIPILTIVLLGICLLSICGFMERNLTKKPEARLYYQSPGGASFQPQSQAKAAYSYGSADDSITKQPYAYSEPDQEQGYNDPAPEFTDDGYRATSPAGFSEASEPLYRPDNV